MIITLPLFLAGMQIGGGLASKLLEEDNPKLAKNIQALVGGFTAGAQGMSSLAKAFGSPMIAQTPTSTEGSGLQIGGLTGSIADKTQQNFAGVKDMMIGSPTNPYNEQASIYNIFDV